MKHLQGLCGLFTLAAALLAMTPLSASATVYDHSGETGSMVTWFGVAGGNVVACHSNAAGTSQTATTINTGTTLNTIMQWQNGSGSNSVFVVRASAGFVPGTGHNCSLGTWSDITFDASHIIHTTDAGGTNYYYGPAGTGLNHHFEGSSGSDYFILFGTSGWCEGNAGADGFDGTSTSMSSTETYVGGNDNDNICDADGSKGAFSSCGTGTDSTTLSSLTGCENTSQSSLCCIAPC